MGAVLPQEDVSAEATNVEAQENNGRKCEFEQFLEGIRIRPISFMSTSIVFSLEKSIHNFLVESTTVRLVIGKCRKYFWGS